MQTTRSKNCEKKFSRTDFLVFQNGNKEQTLPNSYCWEPASSLGSFVEVKVGRYTMASGSKTTAGVG